jgi:hypothetical protein
MCGNLSRRFEMRRALIAFFAIWLLAMIGCSGISVKSDYDPEMNFDEFKTYAWAKDVRIPGDVLATLDFVKKRVVMSVDRELQAKGYSLKEQGEPDFYVVAHGAVQEKMDIQQWNDYYAYDPWWRPYGGRVDVVYYDEGTLVIDIIDADANELVWRGLGTKVVHSYADPAKAQDAIDKTVAKILAKFPPQ